MNHEGSRSASDRGGGRNVGRAEEGREDQNQMIFGVPDDVVIHKYIISHTYII